MEPNPLAGLAQAANGAGTPLSAPRRDDFQVLAVPYNGTVVSGVVFAHYGRHFVRECLLRSWATGILESLDGRTKVSPHDLDPVLCRQSAEMHRTALHAQLLDVGTEPVRQHGFVAPVQGCINPRVRSGIARKK